ncbi:hypothetical protein [Amycolatopsis palatopharyngis]|uniref:hypothetical protein n=1 Tax=Amycolatopsis palatopharyngis TaxID=187982 RepID=UPI000E24DF64|nr:hypothetical protein [Amycolatopsis palatopharyngis]
MTTTGRKTWGVAFGVLAGCGLVAVGLGTSVLWLVWLGVALALVALCAWPLLGMGRDRNDPGPDSTLEGADRSPRATGGDVEPEDADQHSTTGPSRNDTFVGRVAGSDTGSEETGGAERRSWEGEERGRGEGLDRPPGGHSR